MDLGQILGRQNKREEKGGCLSANPGSWGGEMQGEKGCWVMKMPAMRKKRVR